MNHFFLAYPLQDRNVAKIDPWKMLSSGFQASCAVRKLLPMVPAVLESTGNWTGQDSERSLDFSSWIQEKVMTINETSPRSMGKL